MWARHIGHRSEIRSGADGLGRHFLDKHSQGFDMKQEHLFEERVMKNFSLTIIASVEPGTGTRWSQRRLDVLEGQFLWTLESMEV